MEPVEAVGDVRFVARLTGKKMPDPGIEQEKYRVLDLRVWGISHT